MAKIKVTAAAGRMVPLPSALSTKPGAAVHMLTGKGLPFDDAGEEIEVDDSDPFVVATLASGDFVRVATPGLESRVAAKFDHSEDMQAPPSDNLSSTKKGI